MKANTVASRLAVSIVGLGLFAGRAACPRG